MSIQAESTANCAVSDPWAPLSLGGGAHHPQESMGVASDHWHYSGPGLLQWTGAAPVGLHILVVIPAAAHMANHFQRRHPPTLLFHHHRRWVRSHTATSKQNAEMLLQTLRVMKGWVVGRGVEGRILLALWGSWGSMRDTQGACSGQCWGSQSASTFCIAYKSQAPCVNIYCIHTWVSKHVYVCLQHICMHTSTHVPSIYTYPHMPHTCMHQHGYSHAYSTHAVTGQCTQK